MGDKNDNRLKELAARWIYTKQQILNETPSRKHGITYDKELSYRQQSANFIQDMGQRLKVTQLCINTAITYMHRFFMMHSFLLFPRNSVSAASLFLAAKVEEQPRKMEFVIQVSVFCLLRADAKYDLKGEEYCRAFSLMTYYESTLLQTLGFVVAVDHPHTSVVKLCHLVRANKELAQTSYFMASNSLHLTTMCLEYKPTVVACLCIYLASKWTNWEIPVSHEGKKWYAYIDDTVTDEIIERLTNEFLLIIDKCPSRLKRLNKEKAAEENSLMYGTTEEYFKRPQGSSTSRPKEASSSSSSKDSHAVRPSTSSGASSHHHNPRDHGLKGHQYKREGSHAFEGRREMHPKHGVAGSSGRRPEAQPASRAFESGDSHSQAGSARPREEHGPQQMPSQAAHSRAHHSLKRPRESNTGPAEHAMQSMPKKGKDADEFPKREANSEHNAPRMAFQAPSADSVSKKEFIPEASGSHASSSSVKRVSPEVTPKPSAPVKQRQSPEKKPKEPQNVTDFPMRHIFSPDGDHAEDSAIPDDITFSMGGPPPYKSPFSEDTYQPCAVSMLAAVSPIDPDPPVIDYAADDNPLLKRTYEDPADIFPSIFSTAKPEKVEVSVPLTPGKDNLTPAVVNQETNMKTMLAESSAVPSTSGASQSDLKRSIFDPIDEDHGIRHKKKKKEKHGKKDKERSKDEKKHKHKKKDKSKERNRQSSSSPSMSVAQQQTDSFKIKISKSRINLAEPPRQAIKLKIGEEVISELRLPESLEASKRPEASAARGRGKQNGHQDGRKVRGGHIGRARGRGPRQVPQLQQHKFYPYPPPPLPDMYANYFHPPNYFQYPPVMCPALPNLSLPNFLTPPPPPLPSDPPPQAPPPPPPDE